MKNIFKILISLLFLTSCTEKETLQPSFLFSKLDNESTGINFQNNILEDSKHNIVNYLYYYNGGGVSVGDINDDGLPDLYLTSNREKNRLYLNQGNLKFKDITEKSGTGGNSDWNTGSTMVDINGDGLLDIYVCAVTKILGFNGSNELFINNGDGTFREESKKYGLNLKGYATQAYFFDYDKDDDLDVYIVNHALHTKTSHGPSYIRRKRVEFIGDRLLRNDNSFFKDVSLEAKIYGGANGYGLSAAIADFNNDGWDDIYVCNDFHEDDYYYINNGDGTFKNELSKKFAYTSRFSMGSDVADVNNDGYLDLITLDMLPNNEKVLKQSDGDISYDTQDFLIKQGYQKQYARNMLQLNNKGTHFTETGLYNNVAATDWSWSPLFADFNNDGHQDLFVTNGIAKRPNNLDFMRYLSNSFKTKSQNKSNNDWLIKSLAVMPTGEAPNQIFEGNSEIFVNRTGNWIANTPSLSNGAVYADLDLDGDLDIITNNLNNDASIYENNSDSTNNNSNLSIKLNYKKFNKLGIGSKVYLYSKRNIQYKQLFSSRGFISSVEPKLHFGLAHNDKIDSIVIVWPNQTKQQFLPETSSNNIIVNYNNSAKPFSTKIKNKPSLFTKENLILHKHQEDYYNDFNIDKLIPYKVSTQGPAIALSDLNKDGMDDIFIGGASYKKSKLFISSPGGYKETAIPEIEKDSISEDIDAIFIDIDNDNDNDLLVASGIISKKDSIYQNNRIYINDGNGSFKKGNNLPKNLLNTATLKPYDYDQDGDIDIFVGNKSNPKNFGEKTTSYILKNKGNGIFEKDADFVVKTMITDATWTDINNDGIKDLLIASEWDHPRVYINQLGKLQEIEELNSLKGLWQSIATYDIDNDGDQDIMLGNWGLNTKFKATSIAPIRMYYADFDKNGKKETILAYPIDQKYYPVNSKDELASQLPIINKLYSSYKSYANETIEDIIKKLNTSSPITIYKINTLASGYVINNGNSFSDFKEFPPPLQLSSINCFLKHDFNKTGNNQLLTAGNFNGLNTYHGVFNANTNFLIHQNKQVSLIKYQLLQEMSINSLKKQIEKLRLINYKEKEYLIALANDDSLLMYKINFKTK
ncbi:VCBS repeat-containing protein [uncultured Aquimarina sp.]|uniref:VCBS repeat-containing protein n=1 Tax=uncultured Aquimarina sp. TaxID=575652 RepID=UPI002601AE04|nr:VCBS repeat-containing protein [uncultured Aquimarina sp.]